MLRLLSAIDGPYSDCRSIHIVLSGPTTWLLLLGLRHFVCASGTMAIDTWIEAFCTRLWYDSETFLIVLLGPKILSVVATWGYAATMLHAAWGRRHRLAGYISEQFKSRDGYLSFEGGC